VLDRSWPAAGTRKRQQWLIQQSGARPMGGAELSPAAAEALPARWPPGSSCSAPEFTALLPMRRQEDGSLGRASLPLTYVAESSGSCRGHQQEAAACWLAAAWLGGSPATAAGPPVVAEDHGRSPGNAIGLAGNGLDQAARPPPGVWRPNCRLAGQPATGPLAHIPAPVRARPPAAQSSDRRYCYAEWLLRRLTTRAERVRAAQLEAGLAVAPARVGRGTHPHPVPPAVPLPPCAMNLHPGSAPCSIEGQGPKTFVFSPPIQGSGAAGVEFKDEPQPSNALKGRPRFAGKGHLQLGQDSRPFLLETICGCGAGVTQGPDYCYRWRGNR